MIWLNKWTIGGVSSIEYRVWIASIEWKKQVSSGNSEYQVEKVSEKSEWKKRVEKASENSEWKKRVEKVSEKSEWKKQVEKASGKSKWKKQVKNANMNVWQILGILWLLNDLEQVHGYSKDRLKIIWQPGSCLGIVISIINTLNAVNYLFFRA